jgi:hypothetical protein
MMSFFLHWKQGSFTGKMWKIEIETQPVSSGQQLKRPLMIYQETPQ